MEQAEASKKKDRRRFTSPWVSALRWVLLTVGLINITCFAALIAKLGTIALSLILGLAGFLLAEILLFPWLRELGTEKEEDRLARIAVTIAWFMIFFVILCALSIIYALAYP